MHRGETSGRCSPADTQEMLSRSMHKPCGGTVAKIPRAPIGRGKLLTRAAAASPARRAELKVLRLRVCRDRHERTLPRARKDGASGNLLVHALHTFCGDARPSNRAPPLALMDRRVRLALACAGRSTLADQAVEERPDRHGRGEAQHRHSGQLVRMARHTRQRQLVCALLE